MIWVILLHVRPRTRAHTTLANLYTISTWRCMDWRRVGLQGGTELSSQAHTPKTSPRQQSLFSIWEVHEIRFYPILFYPTLSMISRSWNLMVKALASTLCTLLLEGLQPSRP